MYCKNRISDNLWAGKINEEDEGEGKMLKIMHKIDRRKAAAVLVLLLVMILSVTVFSKAASDPENHAETIEALDEKKEDVLKLTATSLRLRQYPATRRHLWQIKWRICHRIF